MAPEALFGHAGTIAMTGWAILLLAPRRWSWLNAVPAIILPALLSALYTILILRHFASAGGGYDTLANVRILLSGEWMLLAGWVHFLAFDLFAGAWMARRMDEVGLNRLIQAPILLLILFFGPAGLLIGLVSTGAMRLPVLPGVKARHAQA